MCWSCLFSFMFFVSVARKQIGVVMYLLYCLLGISAIIGSTVCIITMVPLQFLVGKKMSNNAKIIAVSDIICLFIPSVSVPPADKHRTACIKIEFRFV